MIICQLGIIFNQNKELTHLILWFLGAKMKTKMCEVQKEKWKIGYNKIKEKKLNLKKMRSEE